MSALRQLFQRRTTPISTVLYCSFCSSSSSHGSFSRRLGVIDRRGTLVCASQSQTVILPGLAPPAVRYQPHRNAGHSKWANIKHVKQANDMERSKEITKYVSLVKVAIREHGSADPKVNSKLAQLIQQIKESKVPMASIDRLLANAQAKKDSQQGIYPIRGPGNCIMLIDLESPNLNKTKQELNTVLRKNKGIIADPSVVNLFEHKGLLFCSELDGKPVTEDLLDEATMHAIEAGANDVTFSGDHPEFGAVLEFLTEPSAFFKVKGALEGLKYNLVHAALEYIPKMSMELEDEEVEAANKLYSKLTEHPDVQNVFVNIG